MDKEKEMVKMNIYQKLLKIQKAIIGLGKDGKSFGYGYVTGAKALEHIKPLMNDLGLILKQEVLSSINTRVDYTTKSGAKTEILTKLDMKFTWIDCETGEKDENFFGANGQNDYEKGFGSALTYGERYFLLKYFHIATDEDDIDNPDRKPNEPAQPLAPPPPEPPKAPQLPVLIKGTDKWNKIVEGMADGLATIEKVRLKNAVSAELEKELNDAVKALQASKEKQKENVS